MRATIPSALIPWNSCGAYMAATLGLATTSYAPFVFFNILNPLVSILLAFVGIRMLESNGDGGGAGTAIIERVRSDVE